MRFRFMLGWLGAVAMAVFSISPALAQDPTGAMPDSDTVPTWIFIWTLGLGTTIIGALVAAIKVLWSRMNTAEASLREHYEGSLENPAKGVLPQLRKQHENEKVDLRAQTTEWRTKYEGCEVGRREDTERMRQEERVSLKEGLDAMKDVAAALQGNSAKMDSMIIAAGYQVEEEDGS